MWCVSGALVLVATRVIEARWGAVGQTAVVRVDACHSAVLPVLGRRRRRRQLKIPPPLHRARPRAIAAATSLTAPHWRGREDSSRMRTESAISHRRSGTPPVAIDGGSALPPSTGRRGREAVERAAGRQARGAAAAPGANPYHHASMNACCLLCPRQHRGDRRRHQMRYFIVVVSIPASHEAALTSTSSPPRRYHHVPPRRAAAVQLFGVLISHNRVSEAARLYASPNANPLQGPRPRLYRRRKFPKERNTTALLDCKRAACLSTD